MGVNWKKLVGGFAPAIATAIGVGGGPAGIAVTALSRALLGHDKGSEDDVAEALGAGASPEQVEKIQAAEREFSLSVIDQFVALEKVDADDRANARAMQTANHSLVPDIITYALIAMFAAALVALIYVPVPTENKVQVDAMVEALKLLNMTAVGFWLGGSLGSRTTSAALIGKLAGKK